MSLESAAASCNILTSIDVHSLQAALSGIMIERIIKEVLAT